MYGFIHNCTRGVCACIFKEVTEGRLSVKLKGRVNFEIDHKFSRKYETLNLINSIGDDDSVL